MGSSAVRQLMQATPCLVVLWFSFLQTGSSSLVQAQEGPKTLEFYVHEQRTVPASLTLVAPANASISSLAFGSVIVIDNAVRETNAADSTYLGRQLGSVIVGRDLAFYASYTYLFNTTEYRGSLAVSGIVQSGVLVVTGGTGTFSFVRGVAAAETVIDTPTAGVYKYRVDLVYL